eukprot:10559249-Ditylum_brightwellii.AAC.1
MLELESIIEKIEKKTDNYQKETCTILVPPQMTLEGTDDADDNTDYSKNAKAVKEVDLLTNNQTNDNNGNSEHAVNDVSLEESNIGSISLDTTDEQDIVKGEGLDAF